MGDNIVSSVVGKADKPHSCLLYFSHLSKPAQAALNSWWKADPFTGTVEAEMDPLGEDVCSP